MSRLDHKQYRWFTGILGKGHIGRQLVLAIILFSAFITLLTTSYQLYSDYKADIAEIEDYFQLIEGSYLETLTTSLWMFDEKQITVQLEGLVNIPAMEYLEIRANENERWHSGTLKSKHRITRRFQLIYEYRNKKKPIGELIVSASLDNVYDRLMVRAFSILTINGIQTFFVSCFILFIFHILVIRRLIRLSGYVGKIDFERHSVINEFKEIRGKRHPDEIDRVIQVLDQTQAKLFDSYEALKKSQDELFQIFTMSTDLICIADINKVAFLKVNPAFINTLGFSKNELLSKSFLEFIHPDDILLTQKTVEEELKAGKTVLNFENRYICKDGSYRWFRWVSQPRPEKGVTYAIAHDVTDLKQSVHELEESHQRFLTVLNAIDAHIYVADLETYEILFMNTKMKKDFGRDYTGQLCWESFRGDSGPCSNCTNNRLVKPDGKPGGILTWQGKNPITKKWYLNNDRAIQWIDGRIVRLQIAMDITQYRQTEEELRQAHKMEAVGTMAGGIAHDFNNILGIIVGNIELALEDIPEWHPVRSNLDEVKTASLRARNVVQQLLSFSRKSEHKRAPLILAPLIKESMKLLRASIPTNIDIQMEIHDTHTKIDADPTQIQQVLINLCTNAAHAMEENGGVLQIALETRKLDETVLTRNNKLPAGRYAQLTISDTGKGIPRQIMEKIFDPYFTTKKVGKGSGLGLSIVHGIVANHDGGIFIESRPDQGTQIRIFFPVSGRLVNEKPEKPGIMPRGEESILFVDDEITIVKVVSQLLDRLGYTVVSSSDPLEALSLIRSEKDAFDLLVTDMTMPKMTGDQLVRKIREVTPDLPVIICTGYSERMNREQADRLGVSRVLSKPVVMSELAEAIRKVLDGIKNGSRESGRVH